MSETKMKFLKEHWKGIAGGVLGVMTCFSYLGSRRFEEKEIVFREAELLKEEAELRSSLLRVVHNYTTLDLTDLKNVKGKSEISFNLTSVKTGLFLDFRGFLSEGTLNGEELTQTGDRIYLPSSALEMKDNKIVIEFITEIPEILSCSKYFPHCRIPNFSQFNIKSTFKLKLTGSDRILTNVTDTDLSQTSQTEEFNLNLAIIPRTLSKQTCKCIFNKKR